MNTRRKPTTNRTAGRALVGAVIAGVIFAVVAWLAYASATAARPLSLHGVMRAAVGPTIAYAWNGPICDHGTVLHLEQGQPGATEQAFFDYLRTHQGSYEMGNGDVCTLPPTPDPTAIPAVSTSPAPVAPAATPPSMATSTPPAATSPSTPLAPPVAPASPGTTPATSLPSSGASLRSTSSTTAPAGRSSDQTPIQVCLSYTPSKESPSGLVTRTIKRDETNAYRDAWAPSHLDQRRRTIEGPCLESELHPVAPTVSPSAAMPTLTNTPTAPPFGTIPAATDTTTTTTPETSFPTNTNTPESSDTSPQTPDSGIGTPLCVYADDAGNVVDGIPMALEDGTPTCLLPIPPAPEAPAAPREPAPVVLYCQANPTADECRSTPGRGRGRG